MESENTVSEPIDLEKIPRRKRRFFRNKKIVMKEITKHVEKVSDIKESEKKRILEELRVKLDQLHKQELVLVADRLFDQLGSENADKIISSNIKAHKKDSKELSNKDYSEIADNIYYQFKETPELEQKESLEKELLEEESDEIGGEKSKDESGKEKKIREIKENLAKVQGVKSKKSKKSKDSKKKSKDPLLSTIEEDVPDFSGKKEKALFQELEELSEESKKKKGS